MADEDALAPFTTVLGHFQMHLGYQRTGGVEHLQAALLGFLSNGLRNAMGAEDDDDVVRHLIQLLDEDRTAGTQVFHDELVVHDLMSHIDRRTEDFQGAVDDFDGAIYTRAEAARVGEFDLHDGSRHAKA